MQGQISPHGVFGFSSEMVKFMIKMQSVQLYTKLSLHFFLKITIS